MFIVWRGFGWLVPIVVLGSFSLIDIAVNSIYGEGFYALNEWPKITAVIVNSLLLAMLGYWLNFKSKQVYIDPETGEEHKSPSHTFFFIPVEFWAVIVPVLFFLI